MNNLSRSYVNDEGNEETVVATSDDNYQVKLSGNIKLANHNLKKESKLTKKFKSSLLGSDIGVNSRGFSSVAILSTVLALTAIIIMYFMWRF